MKRFGIVGMILAVTPVWQSIAGAALQFLIHSYFISSFTRHVHCHSSMGGATASKPSSNVTPLVGRTILSTFTQGARTSTAEEKFSSDVQYFVFGNNDDFKDGLTKRIKVLSKSMEFECCNNENGIWAAEFNYVVNQPAVENKAAAHRIRDFGHAGMTLSDFVKHPNAVEAQLTIAEVAALRMYTGPLYIPWNRALRRHKQDPTELYSWATCLSVLYSAILKLSYLSKKSTVYRGVNESHIKLPASFLEPAGQGEFAGGVELAFMSTTTDPAVAIEYATKGAEAVGSVFEIQFDAASRGADVQWVSQYPYEAELLYPPCTYLTCESLRTVAVSSLLPEGANAKVAGAAVDPEAQIRCISVRAAVSTARMDVGRITTCDAWPDTEAFIAHNTHNQALKWQTGITAFYRYRHCATQSSYTPMLINSPSLYWVLSVLSANGGYYPTDFYIHFSDGKAVQFKEGDYLIVKGLPEVDMFNPNGLWFRCMLSDGSVPHFHNPGATIDCRSCNWYAHTGSSVYGGLFLYPTLHPDEHFVLLFASRAEVKFAIKRGADFKRGELDRNAGFLEKRVAVQKAYRAELKARHDASALKYYDNWNTGMTMFYDANDRRNFYVHFDSNQVPCQALFQKGDFFKVKRMPVVNGVDINNIWFVCESGDFQTPHFGNPGVTYKGDPKMASFMVRRAADMTDAELDANHELVQKLLAQGGL